MKRRLLLWMFLLPLFCATFGVGARAEGNCITPPIVTGTIAIGPMGFGDIDVLSGLPSEASGYFKFTCNGLALGQTLRICASFSSPWPRQMTKGSRTLDYYIFTDNARSNIYGPAPTNGVYFDLIRSNNTATFTFFGMIYGNQKTANVGDYFENTEFTIYYALFEAGTSLPVGCDPSDSRYVRGIYSIAVGATITPNCTISATNMTFDPQTIITTDQFAQSALTVKCTNDPTNPIIPYISLDNGLHAASGQRQMENQTKPGNFISYDLYSDSQRSSPWGSNPGVNTVQIPRSASDTRIPVYGKIPKPSISPPAGLYTDRVTATVNF